MTEFNSTLIYLGVPYFNFLKERRGDFSRADFARLQRESLENYLIELIRAVVCLFTLLCFRFVLSRPAF